MHCSIIADVEEALPFHEHAPHELIICCDSNGQLELNSHTYDYQVGRTFLIPSGISHRVIGDNSIKAKTQFICFDDAFAASLGILSLDNYLKPKYLNHSVASRFNSSYFKENIRLGRKLQRELDKPSKFSPVLSKSIIAELLINHCRLSIIPTLVKANSKTFKIEKCCEHIIQDPAQAITVDSMASLAGMSRSHFAQQFKAVTGKSLIEFTNLVRLQKACQMLTHTEDSATAIAYQCGFGNLGHFYNVFKKQYRMTPLDYRQWALQERGLRETAEER